MSRSRLGLSGAQVSVLVSVSTQKVLGPSLTDPHHPPTLATCNTPTETSCSAAPPLKLWRTCRPASPYLLNCHLHPPLHHYNSPATVLPSPANNWENLCSTFTQQPFKATTPHLSDPTLIHHQLSPGVLHSTAFKNIPQLSSNLDLPLFSWMDPGKSG